MIIRHQESLGVEEILNNQCLGLSTQWSVRQFVDNPNQWRHSSEPILARVKLEGTRRWGRWHLPQTTDI